MKMKKQKISGAVIYLLVLTLGLLIYFYFAYLPLSAQAVQMDRMHAQYAAQIASYEKMLPQKQAMQEQIAKLQAELRAQKQTSPMTGEKAAEDVAAACKAAGVTLVRVQADEPSAVNGKTASDKNQLYTVPITLNVNCSGEQLTKLLQYFEKQSAGAYYVNQVKDTSDALHSGNLSAELSLSLYCFGAAAKTK